MNMYHTDLDNDDDIAAEWDVALSDKIHKVTFLHGTITGKRVVLVNGEELVRKNWMFSLVGKEDFILSGKKAEIIIDAQGWNFEYILRVEGKNWKKFLQTRKKNTRTWLPTVDGASHRVVLEVDKMEVWVDGQRTEAVVSNVDSILCDWDLVSCSQTKTSKKFKKQVEGLAT